MGTLTYLQSLWVKQSEWPKKKHIGVTTAGVCEGARTLARFLLPAEEAEGIEHELALRSKTTRRAGHEATFRKEMSFVGAHLATPILLCITGGGHIVRSCAVVDHAGERELLADEATTLYTGGVPVIHVDYEATMAITAYTNQPRFEKLHRHAYVAAAPPSPPLPPLPPPPPPPPPSPPTTPKRARDSPTAELLRASSCALSQLGW
jgi:hypothetical protein